jgi:hypothetical protein
MITAELLCQRAGDSGPEDDIDMFSLATRIACKSSTDVEMTINDAADDYDNDNNSIIIYIRPNLTAQRPVTE